MAAVGPAETAGADPPDGVAIEAVVVRIIVLLEAFGAATRADTALIQPVAVGVQAVLDVVFANFDADLLAQAAGLFPGSQLHL